MPRRGLLGLLALSVLVLGLVVGAPSGPAQGKAEFLSDCRFDHRAAADPIVHPGRRRAGHLHDFFGNVATTGRSTNASLRRTRTSCRPASDRSAYWVPTLFVRRRPLAPSEVTVYYTVEPRLASRVRPYPADLRIVAGNARERGRVPGAPNVWSCLGGGPSGPAVVRCPAGSDLELILNFPDCWDGRRSDSRDHQSHMAESAGGGCPASHPVAVPQLQFKIRWPTRGGRDVALASGNGYSAHGDFMNAWQPAALQARIDACLKPVVKCGVDGRPLR